MLIFNFCAPRLALDEREVVSRRLEDNLDLSVDSNPRVSNPLSDNRKASALL